ncbi:MAG: hypothetical protein HYZ16_08975 [Bacteroidetes bacterium]|nr:hypothetical protein [Bacteroidota bacterium]
MNYGSNHGNHRYDAIANLLAYKQGGIRAIDWKPCGKVAAECRHHPLPQAPGLQTVHFFCLGPQCLTKKLLAQ